MRISSLLALVLILTLIACEKQEQKPVAQPEVKQDQTALANANSKIQELSAQLDQLKAENQRLKAKNDLLASQNANIQPRIQALIAGYGTGIWDYAEDTNDLVFVKAMKGAGLRDVMTELNDRFKKYKQPRIQFKKKDDGTVFIGVDNEDQLGERMGSNGALGFMAIVTYSLTSVKGIDCVYFDIGESEHASPGKYCKDSLEPLTPK
jgi:hypothetical protein